MQQTVPPALYSQVRPHHATCTIRSSRLLISAMLTTRSEGDKSIGQKATDTASGTGDQGNSVLGSAQETLGNAASSVQETLGMGSE